MLMKISKFNLSYLTKSCRHALSPNEKILRHIYFFVAFCDNGDRQREPCQIFLRVKNESFQIHKRQNPESRVKGDPWIYNEIQQFSYFKSRCDFSNIFNSLMKTLSGIGYK